MSLLLGKFLYFPIVPKRSLPDYGEGTFRVGHLYTFSTDSFVSGISKSASTLSYNSINDCFVSSSKRFIQTWIAFALFLKIEYARSM